ncbi:MAG: uracil-DNA glycosylase [Acidobacteria bacterium]|nr:uracil-DNA glycosylase [Acidobacteriota bacterium]MBI3427528.1 uracil-DNA glycosylase [Acidobacteriota bacterium]
MDARDEFLELVRQAKEHLRYYQELGVTALGDTERLAAVAAIAKTALPAPVELKTPAPQAELTVPTSPVPTLPTLPALPTLMAMPEPPLLTLPLTTLEAMPKSEDAPLLFGELEPAPQAAAAAAAPVNETLEDIRREMGDCQRCKLWSTRTNLVFGEGSPTAQLMFVGEGPGADEDASGRPFVGRAGQLLTKMIEAIDLKREQVYIANVVKSRPPGNRTPEADEVKACKPFLLRQIACIKPKLIVTLGNPATQSLLETKVGITRLRGEVQTYPHLPGVKVIPTFHPAYLLRSPDKKREAWDDLKKVRAFLRGELEG